VHVRLTAYPEQAITFTTATGIVVTMPIQADSRAPRELEFDVPNLASISVAGEIASVTGGE
jgi:hypothetical protein